MRRPNSRALACSSLFSSNSFGEPSPGNASRGCARDTPREIDIKAATANGVPVFKAPGRNAESVADLTILLILAQARKLIKTERLLKSGQVQIESTKNFTKLLESLKGQELGRSTVGLVGLGQIGAQVAKRLQGFGAKILFFDR